MDTFDPPSHQRALLYKGQNYLAEGAYLLEGEYCTYDYVHIVLVHMVHVFSNALIIATGIAYRQRITYI